MRRIFVLLAASAAIVASCGSLPGATVQPTGGGDVTLTYEFSADANGWQADFADYTEAVPPGEPVAEVTDLPPAAPDGLTGGAFMVAATNHSDDLFMFLKRPIGNAEGLAAVTAYTLRYRVTFLSDAPSGCAGIGGAPGESVYMKAGAASEEPTVVEQEGDFRLNVDKGNQATGGPAATVVGNVANGIPCEEALNQDPQPMAEVINEGTHDQPVTTGSDGSMWLLVGTDSGFEGRTTLFYRSIEVTLAPVA